MSPKPYEGHSTGPYAYQLTSYRLTPDKAERLADMLDTALDEAENKRERNQP